MITFARHIFATFTYARLSSSELLWDSCSKDFNRTIQRLRRLHCCKVQYLRTLEAHKDGFPHIHTLLQFPSAQIRVSNQKYIDRLLYDRWKASWPHGLSDFQIPRRQRIGQIRYILKYISKNSTSKTIWKRISSVTPVTKSIPSESSPTPAPVESLKNVVTKDTYNSDMSPNPTHFRKQKLCSWSRDFDWTPFTVLPTN